MYGIDGYNITIGPPGTGKTTTIAKKVGDITQSAARMGADIAGVSPVLLCSMTRAARREIERRNMPINPDAIGTLHSHCWRSAGMPPVVTDKHIRDDWNRKHPGLAITPESGGDDGPYGVDAPGDEFHGDYHRMRHTLVKRSKWHGHTQAFADTWESWKSDAGLIDFTDMIDMAADEAPMRPSVVIADEAQDLSALELRVLGRWGNAAGGLLVVGDAWQALYVWRGAHPEYLAKATLADNPDKYTVLAQSYRVPRAVHAVATRWVRQLSTWEPIEYKPRDADGAVSGGPSLRDISDVITDAERQTKAGKTVMLATATNYMAGWVVAQLRRAAVPFANPWRTKQAQWNPLGARRGVTMVDRIAGFLSPFTTPDTLWTATQLARFTAVLSVAQTLNHGAKADIDRQMDGDDVATPPVEQLVAWFQTDAFASIYNAIMDGDTKSALRWFRDRLLATYRKRAAYPMELVDRHGPRVLDDTPRIFVGTVHSYKGGEADVVYLWPDISRSAFIEYASGKGDGRDSVIRTFYVGMTRARETLHLCDPAGSWAVDW